MNAVRQDAGHVFYRKLNHRLPTIVRGQGVFLFDESGKDYLDACGGAMVASCGHGVKEIADAIGAQAATLGYVNGTMFTNEPVEALADTLVRLGAKRLGEGLLPLQRLGSGRGRAQTRAPISRRARRTVSGASSSLARPATMATRCSRFRHRRVLITGCSSNPGWSKCT